jgi:hypothetical protein
MNEGDHSDCPIELRACPEHPYELAPMAPIDSNAVAIEFPADFETKVKDAVEQAAMSGAACLWCGYGYDEYDATAEAEHFSHGCPNAPEELREHKRKWLLAKKRRKH